jgi:hypothetical protein
LLHCVEPQEPETIRWHDLDETLAQQLKQQLLTFFLTAFAILCGCAEVVYFLKESQGCLCGARSHSCQHYVPICTMLLLVHFFESHASEWVGKHPSLFQNHGQWLDCDCDLNGHDYSLYRHFREPGRFTDSSDVPVRHFHYRNLA